MSTAGCILEDDFCYWIKDFIAYCQVFSSSARVKLTELRTTFI
jgi:hypothetical protein